MIKSSIKQRFKEWYFFFFFNKTLALGNWDESSTMIDTPGEKLKSMMEDSCIVKRTGTNATAREFILDEIRDLQCATSSSELFVIATRFPNRLENWFGPQYVDPLLAWHFCRFLDFTNNYNDRWKRKRAWDGRWRDEKIFEISIQFEFSMFGVGFGIDGYWLDICSLWNNGILNAYYRGILFWGGKRFNFFTFDFCIDGIRLMYSFLLLFFSIEGKFKKKIYSNEMLLRDFIGGKSENFTGINFRYSGYNIRNGIKLIPFLSISLFLYFFKAKYK